jgi:hypothetical protein
MTPAYFAVLTAPVRVGRLHCMPSQFGTVVSMNPFTQHACEPDKCVVHVPIDVTECQLRAHAMSRARAHAHMNPRTQANTNTRGVPNNTHTHLFARPDDHAQLKVESLCTR